MRVMRLRPFSRFSMIQLNGGIVPALVSRAGKGGGGSRAVGVVLEGMARRSVSYAYEECTFAFL